MDDLRVGPTLTIAGASLTWTAVRAEGPGGQHVNKTSTKVELRCDPELSGIPAAVLDRLKRRSPRLVDADGTIRINSQRTRSQSRNLDDALERLSAALLAVLTPPPARRPTRPTKGSKLRRLDTKRRDGEKKATRGKVVAD